ncbi:MAG: methylenetetrahydrofolate reductase [NAD(P)H] [Planctomycetaceae bacterium]|nr:methylenetetrahydrofolate reductase [NAD(P)H] [Planctomycetaceae bacterium]
MSLASIYQQQKVAVSCELFPPKTPQGDVALLRHVAKLMEWSPAFVTCTYGAGGSTRDKTLDVVQAVKRDFAVPVASHLTCVGASVDQLRQFLQEALQRGVDHIVALRGDPPSGANAFRPVEGGLQYANELVALIRDEFPEFGVAVAGYPETHREAANSEADLQNLLRKVRTGADVVLTQLFYDNQRFFTFRDRCRALGIDVPIVPGILPITNLSQIKRITSLCGAALPDTLLQQLAAREDADWQYRVGVDFATQQVAELVKGGVPGIHFYVLNKSLATCEVLERVDL